MDAGDGRSIVTGVLAAVAAAATAGLGGGPGAVALAGIAGGGAALLIARNLFVARSVVRTQLVEESNAGALEVLRDVPIAVILLDRQTTIRFANRAADDLVGEVPAGASLASALRARALNDAVAVVAAAGGASDVAFTHMRAREERELLAHVRQAPARFPLDAATILVIEDRSGPARIDRMRRDFIANASHELKTPLASIAGFIETLQGPAKDDPEAMARFLPVMARQAARMKRLIDDLLSLNRIEMSAHLRPAGEADLVSLARETAAALAPQAEAAEVRIETDLPDLPVRVAGERDQLSQLLVNLLDNAIKHGATGGVVRLHLAPDEPGRARMAGISVTDEGPGIPREHIPRLTERFYRVYPAGGKGADGTGLGLSIVKHILNRHRGELAIRSAPGEGSTFTAWLPRVAADLSLASSQGTAAPSAADDLSR